MILNLKKNKIFKETAWSILAKGCSFGFFIGLNVFLARYLGPGNYGKWAYFYSILNIVFIFSYFGINGAAKKYLAQFNKTDQLGPVLKSSLKIRIIYSLFFTLVFLLVSKPLAVMLDRPEFETLFLIALPLIFFSGMVEFFKHAFEGLHRLKYAFYVTVAEHGQKLIFTITALLFANGLVAIIYSFTMALFITSLVGFFLFYLHFYEKNRPGPGNYDKAIMKYSLPIFLVSAGFAVAVELDVLMIGILSVDAEVGIYSVAKQIIVKLPHLAFAIALGSMPVFARLDAGNKKELKTLLHKLLLSNSIVFGLVGLLILTTGWFFVPLIFGQEYAASVAPLMILVLYLVLFSYSVFLSSFLDYQGRATKRALNLSLSIAINIMLNIVLIPRYGAVGAAIGTSLAYIPYVLLNWLEVKKLLARFD